MKETLIKLLNNEACTLEEITSCICDIMEQEKKEYNASEIANILASNQASMLIDNTIQMILPHLDDYGIELMTIYDRDGRFIRRIANESIRSGDTDQP